MNCEKGSPCNEDCKHNDCAYFVKKVPEKVQRLKDFIEGRDFPVLKNILRQWEEEEVE